MEQMPKRKNIRLEEYDYSQAGYYFITVCTEKRKEILSEILPDGNGGVYIKPSPVGEIVESFISGMRGDYGSKVEYYVIMPNHIHLILNKDEHNGRKLGAVVGAFKSLTTRCVNQCFGTSGQKLWQRNYYEHVIRNEDDYRETVEYMENNPLKKYLERNNAIN